MGEFPNSHEFRALCLGSLFALISLRATYLYMTPVAWTVMALGVRRPNFLSRLCYPWVQ